MRPSPFCLGSTVCLLALAVASVGAETAPPRMLRTPDVHGDRLVFSAEGDLWLGSLATGTASRITTHEGSEYGPRFSPDGKWIAFTGEYDGGRDVYVMPAEGGAPRRLTFDPFGAELAAWTPDSAKVLFRSRRAVPMVGPRLYLVPVAGGLPEPLPMEKAAQGSFAPDGRRLAFCRLPMEGHHWKRYRGGEANHVWIADLARKIFRRINDETINEQYPLWIGDTIYYVSEKDGTANLWRYDTTTGRAARVTAHETYDVKSPSGDDRHLVYQWGNSLCLFDVRTGKDQPLHLTLASDRIHARRHTVDGSLGAFGLGPTGKRLIVEGRGQLFTLPVEKGEVRPIAPVPGTRAKEPAWSPDGKWIAFISDRSGEENVWIAPAGGLGEAKQLTREARVHLGGPIWSPDSKRIAVHDEALALWLVDVETGTKTEVARGQYGGIDDYHFSPDGKWLAYARPENHFVQSLYLYNLERKTATRLTFPPTRDRRPIFDPTGKYLYFLSERSVKPQWDSFDFQNNLDRTTRIYLISLAAATPSPLPVESDEEPGSVPDDKPPAKPEETKPAGDVPPAGEKPVENAKPANDKPAEAAKAPGGAQPAPKLPDVKVDLEGIPERLMELPVAPGRYQGLEALAGKILYLSREEPSGPSRLKQYDFESKKEKEKEKEIASGVLGYDLSFDRKKLAVRTAAGLQVVDAGAPVPPDAPKVDLSGWRIEVDPEREWKQIFQEAWRNHRDSFYDPGLHGMDWEAVRRKYEAELPAVGTRAELNEIIGDMQGELNVSHEFVGGGYSRRNPPPSPGIGSLGADLAYDPARKAYRFVRIFRGDGFEADARSPLLAPGLNVQEGDTLLAINGVSLKPDEDPNALLVGQGNKIITLQVSHGSTAESPRTIRVKAMASDGQARYYDWVRRCREYVQERGGPNLGYIHLPDMGGSGIAEFSKQFYADLDKDGLVIDVRYNGGGIVSGQILERLRRVVFEYDQGRYGEPVPYHYTAYLGRVVVLCNERTGSDGEYFCTGFRAMKLGPTVGTRTWGGFMAVSGISAIDGGFISTPVMGSFTPEGKWLPDGYGFNPDVVVDEDPNAFVAGRDPQMDKALELLKEELRRNPPQWPKRLPPPSKEKAFAPNK